MAKVLIICDRPAWAFDHIAQALIRHNDRPNLVLDIFYLKGRESELSRIADNYDLIFPVHWSLASIQKWSWMERILKESAVPSRVHRLYPRLPLLPKGRVITGIHAHHDWDERKTRPDNSVAPPDELVNFLAAFPGVNVVSRRLFDLFSNAGLTNLYHTPNGVESGIFKAMLPLSLDGKLRVGTTGTKKRDWKEGITEFIEPLAKLDFVDLKIATPEDGRYVSPERMPEFLNSLDVYVLASASEGFPLKVLEASSCGRPVVTTKVGGCEELIADGENGFFVERKIEAFIERLELLNRNRMLLRQMGSRSRKIVETEWSWKIRARSWLNFIESHL